MSYSLPVSDTADITTIVPCSLWTGVESVVYSRQEEACFCSIHILRIHPVVNSAANYTENFRALIRLAGR